MANGLSPQARHAIANLAAEIARGQISALVYITTKSITLEARTCFFALRVEGASNVYVSVLSIGGFTHPMFSDVREAMAQNLRRC
jgi:hypothetical protein